MFKFIQIFIVFMSCSFLEMIANAGQILGVANSAKGLFDSFFGSDSNEDAYETAKKLYQNRYQWEVEDLRKAGLNPALGYMKGSAPVPHMPAFETSAQKTSARANMMMAAVSTAKVAAETDLIRAQALKARKEAALVGEQTLTEPERRNQIRQEINESISKEGLNVVLGHQAAQQVNNLVAQELLTYQQQGLVAADTDVAIARVKLLAAETGLTNQQLLDLLAKYPGLLVEQQIDQGLYGKALRYIDRARGTIHSAASMVGGAVLYKKLNSVKGKKTESHSTTMDSKGRIKSQTHSIHDTEY